MRGNIVGLLAAALMAVCGVASANIIYNIDLSGGGETVTGTITTDGTLGQLTPANIVAWDLSAAGLIDLAIASPGGILCDFGGFGGCPVTAEPDGDLVTHSTTPGAFLAFYAGALQSCPNIIFFRALAVVNGFLCPGGTAQIAYSIGTVLGTAESTSVPEPATALLLAVGLVGLGSAYMRARGRQRAAV